jgi:hypothetical protein
MLLFPTPGQGVRMASMARFLKIVPNFVGVAIEISGDHAGGFDPA